jgi:acyl-CoA thioesterase-1
LHKLLLAVAAICVVSGPARAEPVVIAALGDSLTQGYGLKPGDGLVPQLQAWLEAAGAEVRLINAGVSGDTTLGGLNRIDWTLTGEVQGLIVALGGNDVLRGLDPATSRANLEAILDRAEARGLPVLLVGMAAPGNYGPGYKAEFDAIFPGLAATHDVLLHPGFHDVLRAGGDQAALADLMQPDGIHPNARGVALIVEALGPAALDLIRRISPAP